ncbi:MAG: PIN domain-containing protein [Proteobacteria bacterium]|nr:PIN domain-containing protein [Pseudomonadota bacterium]
MIGLDTNILVRYIVRDDPIQTDVATRLIETRCTVEEPGFVSLVVLVELVWVLGSGYKHTKPLITAVLSKLLTVGELVVEETDLARIALDAYETGNADFADYLIGSIHKAKGCLTTLTFDRRASRSPWHSLAK